MWGCRAGPSSSPEGGPSTRQRSARHALAAQRGEVSFLSSVGHHPSPLLLSFAMLSSLPPFYSQVPCLSWGLNQDPTASPAGSGSPWHLGLGGSPDKQLEPLFAESVISKEKTETNHPVGWSGVGV